MILIRTLRAALLVLPGLALCACTPGPTPPPEIGAARVMLPPPGGAMAAGYFELRNPGHRSLVLQSVSSPAFASVEMHETVEVDGLSRMRELETVTVPAGETVRFEPGGRHLMLMGPRLERASAPTEVPLTLQWRDDTGQVQTLEARFAIEQAGAADTDAHGVDHAHH